MSPRSVAISLAVTLLVALFGGWLSRERATARQWSFAVSAAMGLLLYRVPSVDALFQHLVPASAAGWLPWIALCVACVHTIAHDRLRVVVALALGLVIPWRLLWGSIYLGEANVEAATLLVIALWSLAIGGAIAMGGSAAKGRFRVHVISWALSIASSACAIAATGSITYAIAMGVIGVAVLGTLLGASRLPSSGAPVVVCLIGLSVAFSELPLPLGMLLIGCTLVVATLSQESRWVPAGKWGKSLHVVVQGAMVCAMLFAILKLFVPAENYGGYPSVAGEAGTVRPSLPANNVSRPLEESEATESMPDESDPSPDPFAGFGP